MGRGFMPERWAQSRDRLHLKCSAPPAPTIPSTRGSDDACMSFRQVWPHGAATQAPRRQTESGRVANNHIRQMGSAPASQTNVTHSPAIILGQPRCGASLLHANTSFLEASYHCWATVQQLGHDVDAVWMDARVESIRRSDEDWRTGQPSHNFHVRTVSRMPL